MAAYIMQVLERTLSHPLLGIFQGSAKSSYSTKALEFNLCLYSYQQNEDHKVLVSDRDAM